MHTKMCFLCLCICLCLLGYYNTFAQLPKVTNLNETTTNHNVSTTFEISETAINRFLQNQYSTGNIPSTSSGVVEGVTYTLNLQLPEIILVQNAIKFKMAINITSSIGNYSVSIEPTLNLPAWNISLTEISTTFANLTAVVNCEY